jgi:hypothetical protein
VALVESLASLDAPRGDLVAVSDTDTLSTAPRVKFLEPRSAWSDAATVSLPVANWLPTPSPMAKSDTPTESLAERKNVWIARLAVSATEMLSTPARVSASARAAASLTSTLSAAVRVGVMAARAAESLAAVVSALALPFDAIRVAASEVVTVSLAVLTLLASPRWAVSEAVTVSGPSSGSTATSSRRPRR